MSTKRKVAAATALFFAVAANAQLLDEYTSKGDIVVPRTLTKEDRMSSKVQKFVKEQKEKRKNKKVRTVTSKADILGRKGKGNLNSTTTYVIDDLANEKMDVWVAHGDIDRNFGEDISLQMGTDANGENVYWVNGKKVSQKKFEAESENSYKRHLARVRNKPFVEQRSLNVDEIDQALSESENAMVVEKPEVVNHLWYDYYQNGEKLPYHIISPDVMNKYNGIEDFALKKGIKGHNIGMNIIEDCPNQRFILDPSHVDARCYGSTTVLDIHHGALVLGVVQSVSPEVNIMVRNDSHFPTDFDETNAVITNRSYGFATTESMGNTYSVYDQMLDDYVYQYRTADFVSAGNYDSVYQKDKYVTSPAKALNAFSIGAVNPIRQDDYHITFSYAAYSDFINPDTKNDKPEFANVTSLWLSHLKDFPVTMPEHFPGTSASAPYTAATAAIFMERFPIVKGRPAALKALMLASSMTPTIEAGKYETDNHFTLGLPHYRYTENTATTRIRYWEKENNKLFTSNNQDFSFTETNIQPGHTYRAAISWLSSGEAIKRCGHVPQDIDLRVYQDGKEIAKSNTYNNPFEIVQFKPTSKSDLTIKIRRDSNCDANERIILGYALVHMY